MKHREGNFKGLKACNIFYQAWLPDGHARAVLLIAHGFGEHSGRYANVVDTSCPAAMPYTRSTIAATAAPTVNASRSTSTTIMSTT